MANQNLGRPARRGIQNVAQTLRHAAVPLSVAALLLASCGGGGSSGETGTPPSGPAPMVPASVALPPPCVETHDRGCLPESEYESLAAEVASQFADTASFRNQWGLTAIGADRAYANLELRLGADAKPGEGVTVGVLDSGIDRSHFAFRNTNIFERFLTDAEDEDGSEISHGTAVASVIAGQEQPDYRTDASGVAWGADLAVFAIPLGSGDGTYRPSPNASLKRTADNFADIFMDTIAWRDGTRRIDFLNLSLAVQGVIDSYSEAVLAEPMKPLVDVMAQEDAAEKLVFVWAAGNSHGNRCNDPALPECVDGKVEARSPSLLAGLAARFPELKPQTLAVVAISEDGDITDFSNRCGLAEDYCLAAPGDKIAAAFFGPHQGVDGIRGTAQWNGTSFAAPMVTGGLALMKHYFRNQLSNTELAARLLETANRTGPYADSDIYGRGLMDLGAAAAPVGEPIVVAGLHTTGPGAALQQTSLTLGAAFGDGPATALGSREIAAFDSLGAPFWYGFAGLSTAAPAPPLSARVREFQHLPLAGPSGVSADAVRLPLLGPPGGSRGAEPALQLTESGPSAAANARHFALAKRSLMATLPLASGLTASATTSEGMAGETPATGAALEWRAPGAALGLRAGWLGERRSLLGTVPEGAFGSLSGGGAFAGVEVDKAFGAWRIVGNAEMGTIRARAHGGLLESVSPLATNAFALRATRAVAGGGAFAVSLSQPLRVEGGRARFAIPSGRTRAGKVVHERVTVGVAPEGRQVDLAFHWRQSTALGEFRLGATLSREPGHRRGADTEAILLSGWRAAF